MRVSYHHANPGGGNESFLLRFDSGAGKRPCVLVDAGADLDLDALLGPDDRLAAICLTHAHLDHYQSLERCHRDEAPVYASPSTAAVLADVFDVAARDYDVHASTETVGAVTGIDGWTTLAEGLEGHPVPAGHAPGAVGYLFRIEDGDTTRTLLATGDFTLRDAGGYPGLDPESYLDVDVLFLTAATRGDFEAEFSDALGTAIQHAHAGSETLVATSGLTGVQFAVCCAALGEELDRSVPIRVVGQVAKLYEAMGYDDERIDPIPEFTDPRECIGHGTITVAGPEVPHERSSGRIFGLLSDRPNACVVQLLGSGEEPLREGRCTIHDHEIINHPAANILEAVHDAVEPTHTVMTHRHRGAGESFNHFDSCVWSPTDADEYTLYADGRPQAPPWMPGGLRQRWVGNSDGSRSAGQFVDAGLLASLDPPAIGRRNELDLAAEGVDVERVEGRFTQYAASSAGEDGISASTTGTSADESVDTRATGSTDTAPEASTGEPEQDPAEEPTSADASTTTGTTATESEHMATDDTDTDPDRPPAAETSGVFRTTGPDIEGLDPEIVAAVENGELSKEDVLQALQGPDEPEAMHPEEGTDSARSDKADAGGSEAADQQNDAVEGEAGGDEDEPDPEPREVAENRERERTEDDEPASEGRPVPGTGEQEVTDSTTDDDSGDERVDTEAPPQETDTDDLVGDDGAGAESAPAVDEPSVADADSTPMTLGPLTVALAQHAVQRGAAHDSVGELVSAAVESYLAALLEGQDVPTEAPDPSFDIEASAELEAAITAAVARDDRFEETSGLLLSSLGATLGDGESTVAVPGLSGQLSLLDSVANNESYGFESREEVVACAVHVLLGGD